MSTMTLSAPIPARRATRACAAPRSHAPRAAKDCNQGGWAAEPVAGARPSLRLTRRGRLLVFLLALGICAVASLVVTSSGSATDTALHSPVQYVTVLPGDTLWNIANDVAPSADPRDTVAEIIELNALEGSTVQAGQRLAVPAHS